MKTRRLFALLLAALLLTGCGDAAANEASSDMAGEIAEQELPETEETTAVTETTAPAETTAAPADTTAAETDETDLLTEPAAETHTATEDDAAFSAAQAAFAVDLLRDVQQKKTNENVLLSPYSVSMALGLTVNGAAGNTLRETLDLLGNGISADALTEKLRDWAAHQPDSEQCRVKTANAMWFKEADGFAVKPDFLQKCQENFQSEANIAPFDQSTVNQINQWVSDQTNHMIPAIIDQLEPYDAMVLVNAVYFDAKWQKQYEKKDMQDDTFTSVTGAAQQATFMESTEKIYMEQDGAKAFWKPYAGDCAFVGILPPEGVTPEQYLNDMTGEKLQQMLNQKEISRVRVFLPSFQYDTTASLKETVQALGLETPFTDSADYSGISDTALQISKILHKTHIEVDAGGTKAAAATAITGRFTTAIEMEEEIPVLRFDRPFVYMILDTQNELPLFIGTVNQMK